MSFDSIVFWIFFAVAWPLWRWPRLAWAKTATLGMSLVFYGWWNPPYLLLIAFSTVIDFAAGGLIARSDRPRVRFAWLLVSLISNLGLLAFFKYGGFVARQVDVLAEWGGWGWRSGEWHWVVPVGISFYTFQTLSYTIDIYRRAIPPARSFRDFALYVTLFPQLVAGPIVRAGDLLPQLNRPRRRLSPEALQTGAYWIIWGLFMKIVIADNLATPVQQVFTTEGLAATSWIGAWLGVIFFSGQIFADFAGYSAIAIGLAYLMGLRFPQNFNYPYIAASLSEFWTRWHITLSRWLRDYLYIPLGGNRSGRGRTYVNLMVTMLLGGLWHGASWTFIAWGALHGAALCVERLISRQRRLVAWYAPRDGRIDLRAAMRRAATIPVVFVFILITWVFFRADTFTLAGQMLRRMFAGPLTESWTWPAEMTRYLLLLIPLALMHAGQLGREWLGLRSGPWMRGVAVGLMIVALVVIRRPEESVFIYFQF